MPWVQVFRALTELNVDGYEPEVIVLLISLGMDRNVRWRSPHCYLFWSKPEANHPRRLFQADASPTQDTARELVSTLLAELNGQIFRAQDIHRGTYA